MDEELVGEVLVVDDDETQRLLARQYLEHAGFPVKVAGSGEEALRLVAAKVPDLMLLDVRMPGMDGFEVCARVRAMLEDNPLPIVMVTSLDDLASIEQSLASGATDFVTKPVVWETLAHRVRYQLRAGHAIRATRESERQLLHAQQLARMAHWRWDLTTDRMSWSASSAVVFGVDARKDWRDLDSFLQAVHPEDRMQTSDNFQQQRLAAPDSGHFLFEHRLRGQGGAELIVEQEGEVVDFGDGAPVQVVGTMRDVTARRDSENRIHQLAYYDVLTGLPNRELFRRRAQRALVAAESKGTLVGIVFLDLDGFKDVNDTCGHDTGDELLRVVAERLERCLRGSDTVAKRAGESSERVSVSRLGGDEFTVLLADMPSLEVITSVVERVLEVLRAPVQIGDREFVVSGSAGVAAYPRDGRDVEELLKHADIAMYEAKKQGRDGYRCYARHMDDKIQRRLSIATRLKKALSGDRLSLQYQPKFDAVSERIVGVEALLRWWDSELGDVSPATFVPVAEEAGLITQIGEWALEAACSQARKWSADCPAPMTIAVNVSSHQLRDSSFTRVVRSKIDAARIDPARLEFELTESSLVSRTDDTVAMLHRFRELGIAIAVDDFGTGYSSLAHLKDLPIDTLKIDRAFVEMLSGDDDDSVIVRAIIGLAQNLNINTVAEGVETAQQLDILRRMGCNQVQGFLLCRPMPAEELEAWLDASEPAVRARGPGSAPTSRASAGASALSVVRSDSPSGN